MKRPRLSSRWRRALRHLWDYLLITLGALIIAANISLFLEPNRVVPTGISSRCPHRARPQSPHRARSFL